MSSTPDHASRLPEHVDVAILGAGFSGLGMAAKLLEAGRRDFVVLERATSVGGTWRDNTYPGCACDVPSYLYSYSFDTRGGWSRTYAPQPEIRAYLERFAAKSGVLAHVRFGRTVVDARFDEPSGRWTLTTAGGETLDARVVVSGTGALSNPAIPKLAGAESFEGRQFHSATWDHGYDLRGKRVAVIGTGASAIQFVPAIQPAVERLYVHQRTPSWVLPRGDRELSRVERSLLDRSPLARSLYRGLIYASHEARALGFVADARVMKVAAALGRRHLRAQIADAALRAKLEPSYLPGCKRILLSNDWYPALAKPNVELVTEGIERLSPSGVVTRDGVERRVDAVIYGTGFAVHEYTGAMRVVGRGGLTLRDAWKDGAASYLGTVTAGFPNLYLLMGPNTGLGHNSMVYMIESQVAWVMRCLAWQDANRVAWVDVRPDAQRAFVDEMRRRLDAAVWASGCGSWYLDEAGRNTTLWPGFTFEYRARTRRFDPTRFEARARARDASRASAQRPVESTTER